MQIVIMIVALGFVLWLLFNALPWLALALVALAKTRQPLVNESSGADRILSCLVWVAMISYLVWYISSFLVAQNLPRLVATDVWRNPYLQGVIRTIFAAPAYYSPELLRSALKFSGEIFVALYLASARGSKSARVVGAAYVALQTALAVSAVELAWALPRVDLANIDLVGVLRQVFDLPLRVVEIVLANLGDANALIGKIDAALRGYLVRTNYNLFEMSSLLGLLYGLTAVVKFVFGLVLPSRGPSGAAGVAAKGGVDGSLVFALLAVACVALLLSLGSWAIAIPSWATPQEQGLLPFLVLGIIAVIAPWAALIGAILTFFGVLAFMVTRALVSRH